MHLQIEMHFLKCIRLSVRLSPRLFYGNLLLKLTYLARALIDIRVFFFIFLFFLTIATDYNELPFIYPLVLSSSSKTKTSKQNILLCNNVKN